MTTICQTVSFDAQTPQVLDGGVQVFSRYKPHYINDALYMWEMQVCYAVRKAELPAITIMTYNDYVSVSSPTSQYWLNSSPLTSLNLTWPEYVPRDSVLMSGDLFHEVMVFAGSGPWELKYFPGNKWPHIADSGTELPPKFRILGQLRTKDKNGHVHKYAPNSYWTQECELYERHNKDILLNSTLERADGIGIFEYPLEYSSYLYTRNIFFQAQFFDIDYLQTFDWGYAVFTDELGLLSHGTFSPTGQAKSEEGGSCEWGPIPACNGEIPG